MSIFPADNSTPENDSLKRQAALREWHRNPAAFPRSFEEHLQAGDLDRWLAAQAAK